MNMQLKSLWTFHYNDKERWLFVTEQSDSHIAGFEIPKHSLGVSSQLEDIYQLLTEDQKSFHEELTRFKDDFKGLIAFKRYLKEKIKKAKRA